MSISHMAIFVYMAMQQIDSLKLYKISDEAIKFIEKTMKNWKEEKE